jgi:hypothetical protein
MELPHILRLSIDAIPGDIPYIYVRPHERQSVPRELPRDGHPLQVGLAWQSGEWNSTRSVPGSLITRLACAPHVSWHSLQYDAPCPVHASQMACKDIRVMAERMTELDLVISTDTMTAHLAGAIGLPVWLLLQHNCDWRWMPGAQIDSERTLWYPSMRLLRQPRPGDWDSVIDQALAGLGTRAQLIRARDIHSAGYRASSG